MERTIGFSFPIVHVLSTFISRSLDVFHRRHWKVFVLVQRGSIPEKYRRERKKERRA